MKVAKGESDIDLCPHVSPEFKSEVKEALTPPMVLVAIGTDHAVQVGQEEVMYRHEKSFFHEPAIAILVSDKDSDAEIEKKIGQVREAEYERAQVLVKPNLWALKFDSGDRDRFENVVRRIMNPHLFSAVIISEDFRISFYGP